MIGTDAWVQVVRHDARAQGSIEHAKPGDTPRGDEERDKERASKVAEQVRRAAAMTADLAAQSEKEVSEMCSHPPGLHDEPAKTGSVTSPVTRQPVLFGREQFSCRERQLSPSRHRLLQSRRRVPWSSTTKSHPRPRSRSHA